MKQVLLKKNNTFTVCWLKDSKNRSLYKGLFISFKESDEKWEIIELYSREMSEVNYARL